MQKSLFRVISIVLFSSLILGGLSVVASARSLGATAPSLGTAGSFAALGGSTVTNTGSTVIHGDLGVSPGSAITGFPPGIVEPPGTTHTADAVAQQAQSDVTTAYNALESALDGIDLTGQDLGNRTLTPGVYSFDSSAQLTGTLTLDTQGDPYAVFIFQIGSTLTTASNSSVVVQDGGLACNVFWQVGSSATLGTNTAFQGNILASESITLTTGATMIPGRALAMNGALTMDTNTINGIICDVQPIDTETPEPTATSEATTAAPTATEEPEDRSPTNTPVVPGLPDSGGAPIQSDQFPLGFAIVGVFSVLAVAFGIRAYRSTNRLKL